MEKYLRLSSLTHAGSDAERDELIVDSQAAIEVYFLTFENIEGQSIEIFRLVHSTLNPIPTARAAARPTQSVPQSSMSVGFKLNSDLRPALLVKDCTLKEVNNFSEAISNYMQSSPNLTIPEGALWAQVNVNVDQYWLTEIKERKFTQLSKRSIS